jgi:hypothetical protein
MGKRETIRESAREIPVYARCDVLVVGGGPAGCAAASSAAQIGAETILMERYGYLGGMSTGGLVIWIDRMSDWSGRQVITGFANELLDRIPKEGLLGPSKEIWGSRDPELVEYWHYRAGSFNGTVTWSPTIDPEMLKNASFDIVKEKGIRLLLHSWAVAVIQEDKNILGVIFESKSGRQAILAKMVIDTTGDGDIFALAGESFETDIFEASIHHNMNVAFLCGGVDMGRSINFQQTRQDEFRDITKKALEICGVALPHPTSRNDVCVFMGPKLSGYSCLEVDDLTAVEVESRRLMVELIDFYRDNLPGFEKAWIMQTAPQMGVRHSRRLEGVKKMNFDNWTSGKKYEDEIGVSPPPSPKYSNVSIPLHCLIPKRINNLLVAGRNLSCDAKTHNFMREIPNCWVMGQAAGVAATVSVDSGALVRDVNVNEVRKRLTIQGVYLQK